MVLKKLEISNNMILPMPVEVSMLQEVNNNILHMRLVNKLKRLKRIFHLRAKPGQNQFSSIFITCDIKVHGLMLLSPDGAAFIGTSTTHGVFLPRH